jgi:hypothetical protein
LIPPRPLDNCQRVIALRGSGFRVCEITPCGFQRAIEIRPAGPTLSKNEDVKMSSMTKIYHATQLAFVGPMFGRVGDN